MATGIKQNRLVLKVGVVYDKDQALKSARDLQSQLDKQYEKSMSKRRSTGMSDDINKSNKGIKEQVGLLGRWSNGMGKVAEKMSQTAVFGGIVYSIIGSMRQAVTLAIELDTAYTNLAIVSKMTATELTYVDEQVNMMTSSLGRMKKEVIDSITEFSRAGYSIADSMTLAKNAIMGANVGAVGLDKVTTYLIAGLKSFKMEAEDSAKILDVLFTVANITAIDLEGIGEAFLRSANTLKSAGATLEEATALLAAANESIQDPTKVGTALKTIASRLRGVGDEGEVIPTLAKDFEAVGISIQNADDSFRNIYDVFKDLSVVYQDLDDLTRQSLLEKLAGKRQINIMIGLLENFDLAEKSLEAGINSAGSVALAQEKYLESLEGRINLLSEGWNRFLTALTSSEGIKTTITLLTGLVNTLTFLADKLPIILGAMAGFVTFLTVSLFPPLAFLAPALGIAITAFGGFAQVLNLTTGQAEKASRAIAKLDGDIANLNSEIKKIEEIPISDRTDAQNEYLKTLEAELELKKQIRAENQETVLSRDLKDAKRLKEELRSALKFSQGAGGAYKQYKPTSVTQKDIEILKKLETKLYSTRAARLADVEATEKGTRSNFLAQEALKEVDASLKLLYGEYDAMGVVYENLFNKTNDLTEATEDLKETNESFFASVRESVNEYRTLSDAIEQIAENGYLTDEMFDELVKAYPNIIKMTGLTKEAMLDFAKKQQESDKTVIESKIKTFEAEKILLSERIKLYEASAKLALLGGDMTAAEMYRANFALRTNIIEQLNTAVTNADNNIARLRNSAKAYTDIDKDRDKALEKKPKKEKEIRVLTETEAKVRELTNRIAMQQKIMARTEGTDAQIAANLKMIDLQKQLRDALIQEKKELDEKNKNLKKGKEGYEDYIDETMRLSLEIEEATTNIESFTDAIKDLQKSQSEAILKKIKNNIEIISDAIDDSIQKNIKIQEDLAKASAEYYERAIAAKQEEIDAIQEQNEVLDDQIQLQEMLLDLQALRERRQNILDNKNVRLVKNAETGFEWVSDPRELKQVNEDIMEAEQSIDKFRRDMLVKEDVRGLELEIKGLEKEAKAEQEAYQKRIDELEKFQEAVNKAIETNNTIPTELITNLQETLEGIEASSYGVRLENLTKFINEYNRLSAGYKNEEGSYIYESVSPLNTELKDIAPLPTIYDNKKSGGAINGSIMSSVPTANSMASKISGGANSTNSQVSVNTVNVTSSAKTVDAVISDAISKVKIMTQ